MESVRDVGVLYVCDCGPRVPRTVVASPPSASTPDLYLDPCLNVSRAPAPSTSYASTSTDRTSGRDARRYYRIAKTYFEQFGPLQSATFVAALCWTTATPAYLFEHQGAHHG